MKYYMELYIGDLDETIASGKLFQINTISLIDENLAKKITQCESYLEVRDYEYFDEDEDIDEDDINDLDYYDYIETDLDGFKYVGIEISELQWLVNVGKQESYVIENRDDGWINITITTDFNLSKEELQSLNTLANKLFNKTECEFIELDK